MYNVFWHSLFDWDLFTKKRRQLVCAIILGEIFFSLLQFILSVVRASVVRTDRRLGFTPRFSQFIHDKRAVRSTNKNYV